MAPPLLYLRDASVRFGDKIVFEDIYAAVGRRDRIALIGRNGSGKSTLLKTLYGEIELDKGERFVQPGLRVGYLPQEPVFPKDETVKDYLLSALEDAMQAHRVDAMLEEIKLAGDKPLSELSGGEARRVALGRVFVADPDIMLLDEPTNHLDLPAIAWLEERLEQYQGGVMMISHDRAFLRNMSRQMLWMDRGELRFRREGFEKFEAWVDEILAHEEAELARLNSKLKEEERYLHRGVTARRRRNRGRLRKLQQLRVEIRSRLQNRHRSAQLGVDEGDVQSRLVCEAKNIAKSFDDNIIVRDFSTRILRGDRVGLIGPNGAGKTTLLRMLTGQLKPDEGRVRINKFLEPAYFDQRREALDPKKTPWQIFCPDGGDHVFVRGKHRHVVAYLKDFLFDDKQARQPVGSFSGGERNRLLLAKILAQPSNLLVLDEPTNDLDMDTLDLLQDMLGEYEGTLILVSHDRDFLDNLVTSVIAYEGDGDWQEYAGGYADYLEQRGGVPQGTARTPEIPTKGGKGKEEKKDDAKGGRRRKQNKLSYKDRREWENLPAHVETLEKKIREVETTLADPGLYQDDRERFHRLTRQLQDLREELQAAEQRWLELEMLREELEANA